MPRLTVAVALAVVLALFAYGALDHRSVADDAYISFRYLDNWLGGAGLVYNPGERVEGYTNFLWIVLLAPLRLVGLSVERAALALSTAALLLLLGAVFRAASRLGGSTSAGWMAVILAAGSLHLAHWTVSGMETVAFAAAIALGNAAFAARGELGLASSLAFGMAILLRPTGLIAASVVLVGAVIHSRRIGPRRLLAPIAALVALPAAHLVFRRLYYGELLPNTYFAKLSGDLPSLLPSGAAYLARFLWSGGVILVGAAALAVLAAGRSHADRWILAVFAAEVLAEAAFVVYAGGDIFPWSRFLVPAISALAILGGLGLDELARRMVPSTLWLAPVFALLLAVGENRLGHCSREESDFRTTVETGSERELVASWIRHHLPGGATLAINAAGLVPYRTGLQTVDMLGLNDRHIARARVGAHSGGGAFVAHFKHDGAYVCGRQPDLVVTSGARLFPGRNSDEAILQAAASAFVGDRELLRSCGERYTPVAEEGRPGRYLVVYRRNEGMEWRRETDLPRSAAGWFKRGIASMRLGRFSEAEMSFRRSLVLAPGNLAAETNLAFCLLDLGRAGEAVEVFNRVLSRQPRHLDALYGLALAEERRGETRRAIELWRRFLEQAPPTSPWFGEAKKHLLHLGGR